MLITVKKLVTIVLAKISRSLPAWREVEAISMVPPMRAQPYAERLPVNILHLPIDLADHYVALSTSAPALLPALSIYIVKDANVSFVGAPFKNLQLFRPDMSPYTEGYFRNSYLLMQWMSPKHKVKKITKVGLIHDIWSVQNYFHWMVESLPRLLMLRKAFPEIDILVPIPTPSFIRETLALLGFTNLIPIAKGDFIKASTLIVPQKLPFLEWQLENTNLEKHEFGLQMVRNELLNALTLVATKAPFRMVYVSRAHQSGRRVRNEADIEEMLKNYGFEIFYFERLSFEQQARLMQETAVLIGLHGANLTNIMFMQPGTKVVELLNIDSERFLFYFFMASYFEVAYYCFPCNSADATVTNHSDVIINSEDFEYILQIVTK